MIAGQMITAGQQIRKADIDLLLDIMDRSRFQPDICFQLPLVVLLQLTMILMLSDIPENTKVSKFLMEHIKNRLFHKFQDKLSPRRLIRNAHFFSRLHPDTAVQGLRFPDSIRKPQKFGLFLLKELAEALIDREDIAGSANDHCRLAQRIQHDIELRTFIFPVGYIMRYAHGSQQSSIKIENW